MLCLPHDTSFRRKTRPIGLLHPSQADKNAPIGSNASSNGVKENSKPKAKSVYESANWFMRTSLSFVIPLVRLSLKGQLREQDLGPVPSQHEAVQLGARLEKNYNDEVTKRGPKASFFRAVYLTFRGEMLLTWIYNLTVRIVLFPMQTIALGRLITDFRQYERLATERDYLLHEMQDNMQQFEIENVTTTTKIITTTITANQTAYSDRFEQIETERNELYACIVMDALVIMGALCATVATINSYFNRATKFGMRARVAACNMIYRKSLRLSQEALGHGSTSTGQMVNLLSNDVQRFDFICDVFVFLWDGPIQAIVISIILSHFYLGFYATATGFISIMLLLALQILTGRLFGELRLQIASKVDERTRLMNEIIQAIRVIKMYAWEREFLEKVEQVREKEMQAIKRSFMLKVIVRSTVFMSSKIMVFIMLTVYTALEVGPLTAQLVFVTIGLTSLVRTTVAEFFGLAVAETAETLVSCGRINKFLQLPEFERDNGSTSVLVSRRQSLRQKLSNCSHKSLLYVNLSNAITFEHFSARWTQMSEPIVGDPQPANTKEKEAASNLVLRDLNFSIKCNELVLLVGRVGSGKSSVLMAILNELPRASGRLQVNGLVSYSSQEPWLFSGTIEANILFGKPMRRSRYQEVLRVCCLERDLRVLAHGDQTLVGERGVSLSGGQKARVNLARALYQEAEIYLLDDPLSAVDAPVAKYIFSECLRKPGGFLAQKTCLLATHQLQFLHEADKILLMDNERAAIYGTAAEVLQSDGFKSIGYARELLAEVRQKVAIEHFDQTDDEQDNKSDQASDLLAASQQDVDSLGFAAEQALENKPFERPDDDPANLDSNSVKSAAVTGRTYCFYLRNAFTIYTGIAIIAFIVITQLLFQYIDFYLSRWSDVNEGESAEKLNGVTLFDVKDTGTIIGYYALMIFVCYIAVTGTSIFVMIMGLRASRRLHSKAITSLMNAQLSFFERTRIGILLNRLSRDFGFVDQKFPADCMYLVHAVGNCIGIVVLTCLLNPINSFMVIILFSGGIALRCFCLGAVSRLKQLESIARSPLFSHLSTTLNGLATIRSHRVERQFEQMFAEHQNHHTAGFFNFVMCYRWVGIVMYWFCVAFVIVVTSFAVLFLVDDSATSASMLGLLVSQALLLPGPFQHVTKQLIETESEVTSVERIRQLGEDLEPETKPTTGDAIRPKLDRLNMRGSIKFRDVCLRYVSNAEPVLECINLDIKPCEKVGIVGRTGAGKSSIVSVLFRLYDFDGRIELDGVDTKQMPLGELRRSMSIIPQEPVLFGGSLRKNLDPFNEHSDAELWTALEAVQLRHVFAHNPNGLEFNIQEGGTNFSVGQRQLVCLARAIVRRNKLLVLDEATANVDPETDAFIQRTIATQFAHCTVLTIAHRLVTIVDSDRVIVMDKGKVAEFGSPNELLKNEEGLFAQMVESSGQQAPRIKKLIEEAHQRRLNMYM